jgi:predicted metal-binding protein
LIVADIVKIGTFKAGGSYYIIVLKDTDVGEKKAMKKYVVIIQCDIAHRRCSGWACTKSFYDRTGAFTDLAEEDVKYISFTCGGCCGKGVAAKLEHFANKLAKQTEVAKDEVVVHLSSCMVLDHHHYSRCPHVHMIKGILAKHDFSQVVEGTYISQKSTQKRLAGIYKDYTKAPINDAHGAPS